MKPGDTDLVTQIRIEMERIAAGHAACGSSCSCHGGVECIREEHPHEPGNVVPHVGRSDNGELVQWVHTTAEGPILSQEQVDQAATEARREHTRTVLAGLDPEMLRAALNQE